MKYLRFSLWVTILIGIMHPTFGYIFQKFYLEQLIGLNEALAQPLALTASSFIAYFMLYQVTLKQTFLHPKGLVQLSPIKWVVLSIFTGILCVSGALFTDITSFAVYYNSHSLQESVFSSDAKKELIESITFFPLTIIFLRVFFEELVFRKLTLSFFAQKGWLFALIATAIFFQLFHWSKRDIVPIYINNSIIMGFMYEIVGQHYSSFCA